MKFIMLVSTIDPVVLERVQGISALGIECLLFRDVHEAELALKTHGNSVDLGIVENELGIEFIRKAKIRPEFKTLPFVFLSSRWTPQQFHEHQNSALGVNAYLSASVGWVELRKVLETLFGGPLEGLKELPKAVQKIEAVVPEMDSLEGIHVDFAEVPLVMDAPTVAVVKNVNVTRAMDLLSTSAIPEAPKLDAPVLTVVPAPEKDSYTKAIDKKDVQNEHLSSVEIPAEMSYLLDAKDLKADLNLRPISQEPSRSLEAPSEPLIPGSAGQDIDKDTLKKYLGLREQDVQTLNLQLREAKARIQQLENDRRTDEIRRAELDHQIADLQKTIDRFDEHKREEMRVLTYENERFVTEAARKNEHCRKLESDLKVALERVERIKDRVRVDIRKIQVREKELENRIEVLQKDSQALLKSREQTILDLKRKQDMLEFNMDLLQEQFEREKFEKNSLREKLQKASQVVRMAGGVLEDNQADDSVST